MHLQNERINKLGKISFNVLATLLGTTAVAALVGIGTTLAFGIQGAKFTQGAAETSRIAELATRQDAIQDLTIPNKSFHSFLKMSLLTLRAHDQ